MSVCSECGREEVRRHRHGAGSSVPYGRFVAEEERKTVRRVYRDAREREDRREDRREGVESR